MTGKRAAVTVLAVFFTVFGLSLISPNQASAQSAVLVTPPSDVNQVGTPHTVTATVSGCGFFNPNCAGVFVTFQVLGGGSPSPPSGGSSTNGIGQAMFTFTNFTAGVTNTIIARAGAAQGQATKTWVAGPPRSVFLAPPSDVNQVGTPHTVTATVRDQFNNPTSGVVVQFLVSGGGTPTPATGASATNLMGQATFTFTNFTANVTNVIQASVAGCCASNQVTKRWVAGPPARVTLTPVTDTNPVDTQHCVTATVTDLFGNPTPGVRVRFSVTGSVMTSGSATTGPTGQAQFCYIGPALPGADVINAYADTDNDNTQDPGEPSAVPPATKIWVLPTSTPGCEAKITNGGWIIAMNGDRASFGGNAKADEDGNTSGQENYQDHGPATPFHLHGNVLAIVCNSPTSATIFGEATIDGSGSHTYRIDVQDNGEPGKGVDRYRMRVNAYDSGDQVLQGGNVQIHGN